MSLENNPLQINFIEDNYVKKNFEILQSEFLTNPFLLGTFKFFSVNVAQATAVGGLKIAHGLSFIPRDVILTSYIGGTPPVFLYDQFDATNIVITTTGQVTFRALVGAFKG